MWVGNNNSLVPVTESKAVHQSRAARHRPFHSNIQSRSYWLLGNIFLCFSPTAAYSLRRASHGPYCLLWAACPLLRYLSCIPRALLTITCPSSVMTFTLTTSNTARLFLFIIKMIVCGWILNGSGLLSVLNKLHCCTPVLGGAPGTDAEASAQWWDTLQMPLAEGLDFIFISKSLHIFSPFPFLVYSMGYDSILQCLQNENLLRLPWENQQGLQQKRVNHIFLLLF